MQSHFPLGCGDDEKHLIVLNYFMIEIRRFGEQTVEGSSIKRITVRSRGASLIVLFYCSIMTCVVQMMSVLHWAQGSLSPRVLVMLYDMI